MTYEKVTSLRGRMTSGTSLVDCCTYCTIAVRVDCSVNCRYHLRTMYPTNAVV
jgi:hypothetical protein